MAITKIAPYVNFRTFKNNTINSSTNTINSENTINSISNVYPSSYYVAFKGSQKSEEMQQFEKCIDEFYKNNIGENLSDDATYSLLSSLPKTESKFVNDQLSVRLKDVFKNHKSVNLDPKFIVDAMVDSLTELTYSTAFSPEVEEVTTKIEDVPVIIDRLRQEGILPYGSIDKEAFRQEHLAMLFDLFVDTQKTLKEKKRDFLKGQFIDYYCNYENDNNEPKVDRELYDKLKNVLNGELFTDFDKKMIEVHKQDAINKTKNLPTVDAVVEDLYNDSIKKKINIFDNPKFYEYLTQNDAHLDFHLEKIYGYGLGYVLHHFEKSGADPKHKVLLADIGFANRLGEFCQFLQKENIDTSELTPYELRTKFSEHLGSDVVYLGFANQKNMKY